METVAIYMRLSSEDAYEGESCSISNQRDLLYHYVRKHEDLADCNIIEFSDDGYSGMNFERPGIKKLLSLAGNTVECIIVKDFSRFGRNLVEVGDYLDRIFPFLGVRFIAVNEGYDSKDNFGRTIGLDVSLKAMIYEMYSRDISDKIKCVKYAKMRKGEYMGRTPFYGYKKSEARKNMLEPDEPAAEVVRRIFRMAADGMKFSLIARKLNEEGVPTPLMYRKENNTYEGHNWKAASDVTYWTSDAIRRIVNEERYTGTMIGLKYTVTGVSSKKVKLVPKEDWIVVENANEPIVSKELFAQVQDILRHIRKPVQKSEPYKNEEYRGYVKCAYCGRVLPNSHGRDTYYYCFTGKSMPDSPCASVRLYKKDLEQALLEAIQVQIRLRTSAGGEQEMQESVKDGLVSGKEQPDLMARIRECKEAVNRYKSAQMTAFEDYAEKRIEKDVYLSRKKECAEKQAEADRQLSLLNEQLSLVQEDKEEPTAQIGRYASATKVTREMMAELVKEIKVSGTDTIEIVWNFRE